MDSSSFLLRHGEKLVTGGFAAWLVVALATPLVAKPAALGERESLERGIAGLDNHFTNLEVPPLDSPDPLPRLRHELAPTEVPAIDPFGAWLFHRRPSFLFTLPDKPVCGRGIHEPPSAFSVTKQERHRIALAWRSETERNQLVRITGYEVLRQDAPDGPWVSLASLDGAATSFVDTTIAARATVRYRLVETAELDPDDPQVHAGNAIPPEHMKAEVETGPVTTPPDLYLALESGVPEDPTQGPAGQAHATFRVYRWHPSGRFLAKTFFSVHANEPIGKREPRFAVERGRSEAVDFATGAVLVDVKVEKRALAHTSAKVRRAVARVRWAWGEEDVVEGEVPGDVR